MLHTLATNDIAGLFRGGASKPLPRVIALPSGLRNVLNAGCFALADWEERAPTRCVV